MDIDVFQDLEWQEIPELPGLYAFFVATVDAQICDMVDNANPRIHPETIQTTIHSRYRRTAALLRAHSWTGTLQSDRAAAHIIPPVGLTGKNIMPDTAADFVSELDLVELRLVMQIMQATLFFARPAYVGMTSDQTLRDRYLQHRDAFFGGKCGFGSRLRSHQIDWEMIRFVCIPVEQGTLSTATLRAVEKAVQSLAAPALSEL